MEPLDVTEDAEVLIDTDADILEHLCDCGNPYTDESLLTDKGVYCSAICAYRFN